jgi:putative addiction module component (TIGR02574 family)
MDGSLRSLLLIRLQLNLGVIPQRVGEGTQGQLSFSSPTAHIELMSQPAFNYLDLPIDERLQLVEDIWDSIAQEANLRPDRLPLSDAQQTELQRRAADADAHPDDAVPWETVRDELLGRGG